MPEDTHATPGLPPTELLASLADARRRRALRSLDRSSPRGLSALARDVAGMEAAGAGGADVAATVDVELDLYHCQVPALADAGLVRYEPGRALVEITPRGRAADAWLRRRVEPRTAVGCD